MDAQQREWAQTLERAMEAAGIIRPGSEMPDENRAVAARIDYGERTVARWRKGESNPPKLETQQRILALLEPKPNVMAAPTKEARAWGLYVIGELEAKLADLRAQLGAAGATVPLSARESAALAVAERIEAAAAESQPPARQRTAR
jgi:transcriptional regulator with XRE-family HTH domain